MKPDKVNLIDIDNAVYTLRLSGYLFDKLLKEYKVLIIPKADGIQYMKFSDFRRIANDPRIKDFQNESLKHRVQHLKNSKPSYTEVEISQMLDNYTRYIEILQRIHSDSGKLYNILENETSVSAFYLLYDRAISLLKLTLLGIENRFLSSFILLRPIDEAVLLAQYFILSQDTDNGKTHLKEWFRENKSPSNKITRQFIFEYEKENISKQYPEFFESDKFTDLYNRKSKPIHITLNDIIYGLDLDVVDEKLIFKEFGYGMANTLNINELSEFIYFFQSSIWTAVQIFLHTATLGFIKISKVDYSALNDLHMKFLQEASHREAFKRAGISI